MVACARHPSSRVTEVEGILRVQGQQSQLCLKKNKPKSQTKKNNNNNRNKDKTEKTIRRHWKAPECGRL